MYKQLLILTVLLFGNFLVWSQNNCTCDLLQKQRFDEIVRSNDSSIIYQTVTSLRKSGQKNCLVTAYSLEIEYLLSRRTLPQALELIKTQENLIKQLPCSEQLKIQSYFNFANYSKVAQEYENLSKYAFLALEAAELHKSPHETLRAIRYIVHLFTRQNQYEKNWDYIKKAEKIILGLDEDYTTASNFNWLAFEYETKYTLARRISLMDTAMIYATKAMGVALALEDFSEVTRSYRVYESNSYHRDDIKKAVLYIDTAIYYSGKIKTRTNPASLYYAKAWDYMDLNDFKEAQKWQDTCLYYAEKYEGRTPATLALYGEATKLFEQAGNLPKALQMMRIYEKIKDSVFKLQRLEKINELEQKYNKATNERTIKELDQQRSIYILLSLAGLLAVIIIAFFFRQQSLKQKQTILETEQRLNRARMNPHFFFNSLTALQKFALQENNGAAMASNLSRFSNIMRETLESTYKEYVTIEDEMEFLTQYLEVQKVRFPKTFSYEVAATDELEIDELQLPSMIIQPFIENSIEHGFAGVDYPGKIEVAFSKLGEELLVRISDNGKGLNTESEMNNAHISRASQIIKDRLYLLNLKRKTKARFTIENNAIGKGVEVVINLPLLYTESK